MLGYIDLYGEKNQVVRALAMRFRQERRRATTTLNTTTTRTLLLPPQLWYVTTPTQHFATPTGQFIAPTKKPCRTEVPTNHRRNAEIPALLDNEDGNQTAVVVNKLIDYGSVDLTMGDLHVGMGDCTHYCQPGPPDLVAFRILQALAFVDDKH